MVDNNIDSENGFIYFDSDTLKFEYGKGVFKKPDEKIVVPYEQKKYWDSVGLSKEIILSKRPLDDIESKGFEVHYYVNDKISSKDVVWIFPKRFKNGVTGAYFFNIDNRGRELSIYCRNLPSSKIDSFIELIKTIKFPR